jgi:biotin-(acetyl-CoA carboxylase) ligase
VTTTPAASLRVVTGHAHARAELLGSLLWRLERLYESWRQDGLAGVYAGIGSRDFLRGRRISVDGRSGVASGIDRSGRLELDVGGELELVESGEISYER